MTKRKRSTSSSASPKSSSTNSILCVTNFPDYLQSKDLESYFKEIGPIEKITIFYDKQMRAKAYIQFQSELTEDALKFNRASIENERIRLRFAIPQDRDVVFTSIPKSVTQEELNKDYLSEIGSVEEIEQLSDTAYKVRFSTIDEARDAIDFNGADIEGEVITVQQLRLSAQDLQKILLSEEQNEQSDNQKEEPPKKRQKSEASNGSSSSKKSSKKKKKSKKKSKSA